MPTPSLVLYWLKDGGSGDFPVSPLTDILKYRPYPAYVNLFKAQLSLAKGGSVGVKVPAAIAERLASGHGKQLQAQGIKVVLSIANPDGGTFGWSTMTTAQSAELVDVIGALMSHYGVDGIDIDDEGIGGKPSNFYGTVSAIRAKYPSMVISNAVYDPQDMKKYQDYPDLANLITYCATMNYGNSYEQIIGLVKTFNGLKIPMSKLYAGVQPGPYGTSCAGDGSFTTVDTSISVARWTKTNCAGVMIYSFSQDIIDFTTCPQYSGFPNPKDHGWQKAVSKALFES